MLSAPVLAPRMPHAPGLHARGAGVGSKKGWDGVSNVHFRHIQINCENESISLWEIFWMINFYPDSLFYS
jgi:hypothetical protein